jgi:hypothetical protein
LPLEVSSIDPPKAEEKAAVTEKSICFRALFAVVDKMVYHMDTEHHPSIPCAYNARHIGCDVYTVESLP